MAAAVTFVVAAAIVRSCGESEWEKRAQQAEQFAEQQLVRADSAEKQAASYAVRADSLARSAEYKSRQVRERVKVVREAAVPDTCRPFVVVRDSLLDGALAAVDEWESAYDTLKAANDNLTAANGVLRTVSDSLLAVVRARPKPRPRFLPEIGPYIGVGAGTAGAGVQVGVGLVWRF
jgi:hypothetical protein